MRIQATTSPKKKTEGKTNKNSVGVEKFDELALSKHNPKTDVEGINLQHIFRENTRNWVLLPC